MDTLFIESIPVIARHGETGREIIDPQRYEVSVSLDVETDKACKTDKLVDTYDYKKAYSAIKRLAADSNHVLIESLGEKIATHLCRDPRVYQASVTIRKVAAFEDSAAGVKIVRKRVAANQSLGFKSIDFEKLFDEIRNVGGASVPFLEDWKREELLREARLYKYTPQPTELSGGKVKEELSSVNSLSPDSLFSELRDDLQILFSKATSGSAAPFKDLHLNELSLQKYDVGSIGITPHMDFRCCVKVICLIILTGQGRLAICKNRAGDDPIYLDTSPGNLIVMRAPGFDGSDFRPFHFLRDISEERIVFGLRENNQM